MAIVEAISIPIGVTGQDTVTQAANAYEDLGDAVAKTQLEAEKLANTFGINDKRTQEAIKVAGKYKQEMEQLDSAIDGARGGVATLTSATQGVVAGFEIAAGVAGLFGDESEDLQKMLLKVQSAMALSQGIADFKAFLPAILSTATAIKTQLVTAFASLRSAIISTGIGALVVAIALLIDEVFKYNDAIDATIDKELELAKIRGKEGVEAINAETRAYESATEIRLLLAKKQGQSEQEVTNLQISLAKERRDALRLAYADEALTQEERAKSLEEYNKISDNITKLELNRDIAANAAKKELSKQAAEDAKKAADDEFNAFIAQEVANEEYREQQRKAEQERIDAEFEMEMAQIVENDRRRQELADEEFNNFYAQEVENERRRTELKDKEAEQDKARKKAVADLEQEIFDNSQALAAAIISIAGQNSKAGKAIALASIAADTAMALSGALANSQAPTPDNVATGGLAGIAKYIALATTILTNSKRAYDIIKAPAPSISPSGGGGGAAAAAVPRFNAPSTRIPGGGDEFTQVRRIYVTERDITNVQDKVRVTEGLSQF
jgi:hypothetical protein